MNWRRCMFLFTVLCGPVFAVTLQDDRGRVIELAQPPQRIISILPSLTEMVCELGQCQRLVGVDRYSTWPPSLRQLPRVGGILDPNIEAIVALHPDLVLASTSSRAAERLQALGIPVLTLETQTHADVKHVLEKLGLALGVRDSQRIWRHIDAGVIAATQSLPPSVRQTRVYFEVSNGPYGAGESGFIGETLKRLGVKNILPRSLGPFPKLNPEFVVRANPDVIMIGERNATDLMLRPGWSRIRAVREGRVCIFPIAEFDVLVRPGPRMPEAARLMARCLLEKAPSVGSGRQSSGEGP